MKIAIIGTGNVGGAVAQGLRKSSHTIVLGARDVTKKATRDLAADVGAELEHVPPGLNLDSPGGGR